MKPVAIQTLHVQPRLPDSLIPLLDLSHNLMWAWDHDMRDLFGRIDRDIWEATNHNPLQLLGQVRQERIQELAEDEGFLAHLDRCYKSYQQYTGNNTWFSHQAGGSKDRCVAYFSMEFGIVESLPIYSGGLGILAGDHLKSASDLGVPLVGIGLLYQEGYLEQYLNADGWQQERYPRNDFHHLPLSPVTQKDGSWQKIRIEYPDGPVLARILVAHVGRIRLYLLDSDLPENRPADRSITGRLYGGDRENRIRQEIMLGIGGIRALEAMGIEPDVCHMNEGHSAFLALERIRLLMQSRKLSFQEARQYVRASTLFTTHTPVPAGIDQFSHTLMNRYFTRYREELGLSEQDFLQLGHDPDNTSTDSSFNMAHLAINFAFHLNGVSRLHGEVSREMWAGRWNQLPESEVPIDSITNGVHILSWISREMSWLYTRYLGPDWFRKSADHDIWKSVSRIPDEELWRAHQSQRANLVSFTRQRLQQQLQNRGASTHLLNRAGEVLDPQVLTIGFARRFATYKRASLLFRKPERLLRLLNNKDQPIQFVIAGKAHPNDDAGKELIRLVHHFIREHQVQMKIVFLENYDMNMARTMVQGVDVWLNTPRRPMEASGTSGMKILPNGGLNLSVLDGWWVEGYTPETGWSIGGGESLPNPVEQDDIEADALYDLLENEIVPLFYERDVQGTPRLWVRMMRESISRLCPVFNTNRMVQEYTTRYYIPAIEQSVTMAADSFTRSREFSRWLEHLNANWNSLIIRKVESSLPASSHVGDRLKIHCEIDLGKLAASDIQVELFAGIMAGNDLLAHAERKLMDISTPDNNLVRCSIEYPLEASGRLGYTIRVLPHHQDLPDPLILGKVHWARESKE